MIKFENTEVVGWEHAIRGMRNPMNSWEKSDSFIPCFRQQKCHECPDNQKCEKYFSTYGEGKAFRDGKFIGSNDHDLMMRLAKSGPVHAKYRRMITVYVDITAPLYWWKEFDTYKVGTVANSCSTMHKIAAKEFTLEDFSCEHLENLIGVDDLDESLLIDVSPYRDNSNLYSPTGVLTIIIRALNRYRNRYLETKDKKYWRQMIQLLPSSYNQKRTVMMNYEVLANIYKARRNHKLDEWSENIIKVNGEEYTNKWLPNDEMNRGFCDWIKTLPYSGLITGEDE